MTIRVLKSPLKAILTSLFILTTGSGLLAQHSSDLFTEEISVPKVYTPIQVLSEDQPVEKPKTVTSFELAEFEKQVMQRMSEIYEMQIKAMRAEVKNKPLAAEGHILKALSAIKDLLENYPRIKNSKRFAELYSTVYTEYRQFYGIDKAINEAVGKVFAIRKKLSTTDFNWELSGYQFPDNLNTYSLRVQLIQNEPVKRHLLFYTQKRPDIMESWLKRTEKYFPMMRRIFKDVGAPVELIHLAMIESGLNPRAESWASAMGMWQFMEATGAAYGLDVNWWVDERRDPVKATRAAARHLKDLHERWDDWHLAIAGYNISPRGLISAIRDGGGEKNYWTARPYLPNETQGYIPGFIAATMIELNREKFGFREQYNVEPYRYQLVEVAPLMPLDLLAEAAGISTQKLKAYNPELLRWATPPGSPYKLKIPPNVTNTFLANYKKIPEGARSRQIVIHEVQSGETLGYIANRYGATVRALYETNEGLSSLIYPGEKIIIPVRGAGSGNTTAESSLQAETTPEENDDTAKVYYTVKSGDTIGHIAEWYDVSSSQIRNWNNTSNLINVGDRLIVYVSENKEDYYASVTTLSADEKQLIEQKQQAGKVVSIVQYQVQSNDTLIEIAQNFNVTVASIKQANDLESSRIYPGQQLRISTIN